MSTYVKNTDEYKNAMCLLNANISVTLKHSCINHAIVSFFLSKKYFVSIDSDGAYYKIYPKKRGFHGKMAKK